LLSFLLSVGGFLMSAYAIKTAINVKSAVDGTIIKVNIQNDIPETNDILRKLDKAKSAANKWVPGAIEEFQVGKNCLEDLKLVRDAEDALSVWVPADMEMATKSRMEEELIGLRGYCDKIADPKNNENHWNGVVVSSQSLIRLLREYSRTLENSQLIAAN